jgi:hypothetical protein
MLDLLLFDVRPLRAFNFQAREQPPLERVCRRLTRSAIDHNSFWHNNESSFRSLMTVDIFILESSAVFSWFEEPPALLTAKLLQANGFPCS